MYKKSDLLVIVVILSMFYITSCKKKSPTEPTEPPASSFDITVGSGLQPRYSWTDANGNPTKANRLDVYLISNSSSKCIWGISACPG